MLNSYDKIYAQDYRYILDTWKKFVELTPTETENLKKMALNQRQKNVNRLDYFANARNDNKKRKVILWITL